MKSKVKQKMWAALAVCSLSARLWAANTNDAAADTKDAATVAPAACFVTHAGFTLKFVEILPSVVGGQ